MNYGLQNDWIGFLDVDEYFQLNASHADAVHLGSTTLAELMEAELAKPCCEDGFICDALQFESFKVLPGAGTQHRHPPHWDCSSVALQTGLRAGYGIVECSAQEVRRPRSVR